MWFHLFTIQGSIPFGPGVDDKSAKPFMPVPAEVLANQGVHIPFLIGQNAREGLFFLLGTRDE